MGANDFTQKIAIEKMTINALKVFLVIFSIPIFWGEIISPHGIPLFQDVTESGESFCIFFYHFWTLFSILFIFSKAKTHISSDSFQKLFKSQLYTFSKL